MNPGVQSFWRGRTVTSLLRPGPAHRQAQDRGIALVLSLFLMLAMSVVAGSLMFLSQTETYASMNYRLMSQARYAAESGVHKVANYLLNSYAPPSAAALASYDLSKSPVVLAADPTNADGTPKAVVLSPTIASSNYPDTATKTAFAGAATGPLSAGTTSMTYSASAKLIAMRQISVYGSTTPAIVQTWLITSTGTIAAGARTAQIEVSATLEREVGPAFQYGAFAVYNGCDALDFSGLGHTDSYDSTVALAGTPPAPALATYGGDVGTNGNLTTNGTQATINGSLSTPRTGNGSCTSSNVTAVIDPSHVTGGVIKLPQPVPAPTPAAPNPMPPANISQNLSNSCSDTGFPTTAPAGTPTCSIVSGNVTLDPNGGTVVLSDINLNGNATLHMKPGAYNINSITATGSAMIAIDAAPSDPPIMMNVAGTGFSGSQKVVSFAGQMASNTTYDPTKLQIVYAGTARIEGAGGSDNAALVYAPNASVVVTGGSDWYGAIVGEYVTVNSGAIHYDRHLQQSALALGNYMLSSFTWKKY